MTSTIPTAGSAERWGPLWGARPEDWARTEEQQLPTYGTALRAVTLEPGQSVLEVGCGSGVFLSLAADRGARLYGLDASEALLAIARRRVPEADLRLGDLQFLPYEDDAFDLVAGFNSFFFAADMVAALREARRVARPGAAVVIQVWGRPERCDLETMKQVTRRFLPAPPPDAPPPRQLWRAGVLEDLAGEAGLRPERAFTTSWAYAFSDDEALAESMMSVGGLTVIVSPADQAALREQIVESLAPYRTQDGGYRLENEWRFLIARA